MSYDVNYLINRGYSEDFGIEPFFNINAVELVKKKIVAIDSERISLVQGPPGTGKTTIFHQVINECLDEVDENEVFLYIAPTNKLVADMLTRVASIYRNRGRTLEDLKKEVRVYGSRFRYGEGFEHLRKPIDNNVKIVLSTEYQRIYESEADRRYHLLIDEASKSPIHRPLITISDRLLELIQQSEGEGILESLNVIGDPKQAIALGDEYRGREDLLLLTNLIRGLLSEKLKTEVDRGEIDVTEAALRELRGIFYEFLEITRRLPYPSETPISVGFYSGNLRAYKKADEVLKEIANKWDSNEARELSNLNEDYSKTVDILDSAISTGIPIIYVHVRGDYLRDYLFNERKAKVGLLFSCAIKKILKESVTVVAPYVDQQLQMKLRMQHLYGDMLGQDVRTINFTTVHRMLGAEDSHIIAVLGKERTGKLYHERTIYFMEPEVFNVQLSRHKKLLVIVGDLFKLRREAKKTYEYLSNKGSGSFQDSSLKLKVKQLEMTAEQILELANIGSYDTLRGVPSASIGDGCLFFRWE